MKLATLRTGDGTVAARVSGDEYVEIDGFADVGALLATDGWLDIARTASGHRHRSDSVELGMLVPAPSKVLCVGLNYRSHIVEMGREIPEYPTVFAKFADTLTGPYDAVEAAPDEDCMDFEGELGVVIGRPAHRVSESDADEHIAGYVVANDITMRSWQYRTPQWLQGKMWARSTPIGPVLATPDEVDVSRAMLRTSVNGITMQEHSTHDLLFTPRFLVSYLSAIVPLRPGDIILTGTPGGVGHGRTPRVNLGDGDVVEVEIDGIGRLRTRIAVPATVAASAPMKGML